MARWYAEENRALRRYSSMDWTSTFLPSFSMDVQLFSDAARNHCVLFFFWVCARACVPCVCNYVCLGEMAPEGEGDGGRG